MATQLVPPITHEEKKIVVSRRADYTVNPSIHRSIGIIGLSDKLDVLFTNQTALCLLGHLPNTTHSAIDLLGPGTTDLLNNFLQTGPHAQYEEYEVEVVRRNGSRIPVAMTIQQGPPFGSQPRTLMVMMRSLVEQRLIAAVRDRVLCSSTANDIFRAMAEEVCRWIPFVHCGASVYDGKLRNARVVFGHGSVPIIWPSRWFELTREQSKWLKEARREAIPDLHNFRNDPRFKAVADSALDRALAHLKSSFRVPVVQNGQVVGSLNFFRDVKDGFTDEYELELLHNLPVDTALLMALSYLDNEKLRFHRDLVEQLAARPRLDVLDKTVSQIIVNHLAQHYDWEAISLFRVNRQTARLELQAETGKQAPTLPPNFSLRFDEGVMGRAFKTGKTVCIPDIAHHKIYKPIFVQGNKFQTLSELCIPIRIEDEIAGMLNIEDPRRNAFAEDEVNTIVALLDTMVKRQKNDMIIKAAFEWTPSALFLIKQDGAIDKVNSTAVQMLGREAEELEGKPLGDVLEPVEAVRSLVRISCPFRDDMSLIRKDGRRTKVSVASSRLGNMGSIVTAKDLASRQRIEELKGLETIFYDVAAQTRLPLALAFSWLTNLKQQIEAGTSMDTNTVPELEKVIRQLKKAEITYDHLALYDKNVAGGLKANPVIIEIAKLLDLVLGELPLSDAQRIEVSGEGVHSRILADVYQVSFVLLSLLSYGLRLLPESQKLTLGVGLEGKKGKDHVQFQTKLNVPSGGKHARRKSDVFIARVISDVNIGRRTMQTFVRANRGRLTLPEKLEGNVRVAVAFPLTQLGE